MDDDSMDTMELYRLFDKQDGGEKRSVKVKGDLADFEGERDDVVNKEGYFSTLQEENDVLAFLGGYPIGYLTENKHFFFAYCALSSVHCGTNLPMWCEKKPQKKRIKSCRCVAFLRLVMVATCEHMGRIILYYYIKLLEAKLNPLSVLLIL